MTNSFSGPPSIASDAGPPPIPPTTARCLVSEARSSRTGTIAPAGIAIGSGDAAAISLPATSAERHTRSTSMMGSRSWWGAMSSQPRLPGLTHALRLPSRVASMETHCGYPIELLSEADSIALHDGEITCAECARVSAERPAEDEGSVHVVYIPASGQ